MNQHSEHTNLQDRRRTDSPAPVTERPARESPAGAPAPVAAAANTPPPGNGHDQTPPRHRDSEGGLNLKPSGRTHAQARPPAAPEDRATHPSGQTVGQIAVENPLFSCRDVSVYYGQKHAL